MPECAEQCLQIGGAILRNANLFYFCGGHYWYIMFRINVLEGPLSAEAQGTVIELYQHIFGSAPKQRFYDRLATKSGWLLLIAVDENDRSVGYKLGFEADKDTFYSWLGGVLPSARGYNLGKRMMDIQHDWCIQKGYSVLKTSTFNKWKHMLILNIQSGFEIVGTEWVEEKGTKILLEKKLTKK
jgi:GNAT superfamily N-acetyltransferase